MRRIGYPAIAAAVLASAMSRAAIAETRSIALPGLRTFPESITSTAGGTLFIGRLGDGGIVRANARSGEVAVFVPTGAHQNHSPSQAYSQTRRRTRSGRARMT
jgi:hypothetical protein